MLHLFNIFHENKDSDNCAQLLEEECIRMFGTKSLNDDCNVVSMNCFNIHDANDMQSHKLGEAMFDEDDSFCSPSFDEKIYYDESMPHMLHLFNIYHENKDSDNCAQVLEEDALECLALNI